MPHFLTLYEKSVPMVVVWVSAEDPVVSLRSRYRHRGFRVGSNIHAGTQKAKQNMRVRRNKAWQLRTGPNGNISANQYNLFTINTLREAIRHPQKYLLLEPPQSSNPPPPSDSARPCRWSRRTAIRAKGRSRSSRP